MGNTGNVGKNGFIGKKELYTILCSGTGDISSLVFECKVSVSSDFVLKNIDKYNFIYKFQLEGVGCEFGIPSIMNDAITIFSNIGTYAHSGNEVYLIDRGYITEDASIKADVGTIYNIISYYYDVHNEDFLADGNMLNSISGSGIINSFSGYITIWGEIKAKIDYTGSWVTLANLDSSLVESIGLDVAAQAFTVVSGRSCQIGIRTYSNGTGIVRLMLNDYNESIAANAPFNIIIPFTKRAFIP